VGNPSRQRGWVSEAGIKLNFSEDGMAICTQTGRVYKLKNGFVAPAR